ncbi:MAG: tRNA (cytidine(34)-2'-O)-methyltransferase [Janthinobacterium lividum]
MRLALYQPEIPQNTGTLLRLCACWGVPLDIIEPCGFSLSDTRLRRAGMDYVERAQYQRHASWQAFQEAQLGRIILLTPHTMLHYTDFSFGVDDILLLGQESVGVPDTVADQISIHVKILMLPDRRSINVALSGAIVLGEALRQTNLFPERSETFENVREN